jgi:hypothetical protein
MVKLAEDVDGSSVQTVSQHDVMKSIFRQEYESSPIYILSSTATEVMGHESSSGGNSSKVSFFHYS